MDTPPHARGPGPLADAGPRQPRPGSVRSCAHRPSRPDRGGGAGRAGKRRSSRRTIRGAGPRSVPRGPVGYGRRSARDRKSRRGVLGAVHRTSRDGCRRVPASAASPDELLKPNESVVLRKDGAQGHQCRYQGCPSSVPTSATATLSMRDESTVADSAVPVVIASRAPMTPLTAVAFVSAPRVSAC